MTSGPRGPFIAIVGWLVTSGIVELTDQSQYGIRRLAAAAVYVSRWDLGYFAAMVAALPTMICCARSVHMPSPTPIIQGRTSNPARYGLCQEGNKMEPWVQ
jgi:hypothetical protein